MDEAIKSVIIDYKQTFGTDQGRRVFKDLMSAGFLDQDLFNDDQRKEAYNVGRNSLALRIKRFVEADLEALEKKEQERKEAEDVQD